MQNVHLLLGAICSRYSARVRSYLIKKRIPYVERVPTAWTYMVTIKRRFGDASLPVIVTPEGEWIADSEIILDRLEARYPEDPILPPDPVHAFFTTLASVWASEFWQPVDLATRWLGRTYHAWWYEELGEAMFFGLPKSIKNRLTAKVAGTIQAHLPRHRRHDRDSAAHLAMGPAEHGCAGCPPGRAPLSAGRARDTHRLRPHRAHVRPPRAGPLVARRVRTPAAASPRVDLADEPAVHDAGCAAARCRRDAAAGDTAADHPQRVRRVPALWSRARSPNCAAQNPGPCAASASSASSGR